MRRDILHLVIWKTKSKESFVIFFINEFSQLSNRFSLMSLFYFNFILSFISIFFNCESIIAHCTTLKQRKMRFIRKKKIEPLYTFGCTSFFRTLLNVLTIFTGPVRLCSFGNQSHINNFEFIRQYSILSTCRIPVIVTKFFDLWSLSFTHITRTF